MFILSRDCAWRNIISDRLKRAVQVFIFVGFFFPMGFAEVSQIYSIMAKMFLYAATLAAALMIIIRIGERGISFKPPLAAAMVFFLTYLIITLLLQGGVHAGLRSVVAWPILLIYTTISIDGDGRGLLGCITKVLTIYLLLDLLITPFMFNEFLHIRFIGHVQVVAQIILLNFAAILLLSECEGWSSSKTVIASAPAMLDAMFTDADSAKLMLVLFTIYLLSRHLHRSGVASFLGRIDGRFIVIVMVLLNLIVVALSVGRCSVLGMSLSFNGRDHIWSEALRLYFDSPIYGYGAHGVLINTFWGASFNYAHNQIMQELLDGGAILAALFIIMLFVYSWSCNRVESVGMRSVLNFTLIGYLIVMIFDAVNLYCFFFVYLPLLGGVAFNCSEVSDCC